MNSLTHSMTQSMCQECLTNLNNYSKPIIYATILIDFRCFMRRRNYELIWPSVPYICMIASKGQLRIQRHEGDRYFLLSDIRAMMPVTQAVLRCQLPELLHFAQIPDSDILWAKTKSSAKKPSLFVHERALEPLLEFFKKHPKVCDRGKYRNFFKEV